MGAIDPPLGRIPTGTEVIGALAQRLYDRRVMDNRERGDYAEQLVAEAIGNSWVWVGIGWHSWDFQRGSGNERVRLQVKQSAMKQVWARPAKVRLAFDIPERPRPRAFEVYWPNEAIEDYGHFCEIFVFAWHGIADETCDHRDPAQWEFFVIPAVDLKGRNCVLVSDLASMISARRWVDLGAVVNRLSDQLSGK